MKIRLTKIYVEDTFKAYTFYTEVLGLMQRYYLPDGYLAIVASPEEPNGTGLLLFTKELTQTDWGIEAVYDDTCGNLIQLLQL